MSKISNEPMLEMFIFETNQLLEQLEQIIISIEKSKSYSSNDVNEIFRIMHTIKGSSMMMAYNNISELTHSSEDLFYFIRETSPFSVDLQKLTDLVLKGADFIKTELAKIEEGKKADTDSGLLIDEINDFLEDLKRINSSSETSVKKSEKTIRFEKQEYVMESGSLAKECVKRAFKAVIYFEDDCKMENIRAFAIVQGIKDIASHIYYSPINAIDDNEREEIIRDDGFKIIFSTDCNIDTVREILMRTVFLKHLSLEELSSDEAMEFQGSMLIQIQKETSEQSVKSLPKLINQSMISVNVSKLDKLMDLVGELVISEAMLTQNPDIKGLSLENFSKAARQHRKITSELQDTVMSVRMVPLSATFQRMNRIVRDMCKKLNKNVRFDIIGEETEVDKKVVEYISDPLMHIIRNAVDHGIESEEERALKGKDKVGLITLEAKNAGGDALVIIRDDGKGLHKEKIFEKARKNGLINKAENDLTDREIYSFIFLPGFSTKDNVSEFSGRGVGMDVVMKNIEKTGGSVSVDSIPDEGTTVTIKIPLTLAIMNGMTIKVGRCVYTLPILSIKESFKVKKEDIIIDPEGNEMIMIRGECYPVLRLHELYKVQTKILNIPDGIIVMVENEDRKLCILVDELIGEQQVVVKSLPAYIMNFGKTKGVEGCTLLGDGNISLILSVSGLISINRK